MFQLLCLGLDVLMWYAYRLFQDAYTSAETIISSALAESEVNLCTSNCLDVVWTQVLPDPFLRRLIVRYLILSIYVSFCFFHNFLMLYSLLTYIIACRLMSTYKRSWNETNIFVWLLKSFHSHEKRQKSDLYSVSCQLAFTSMATPFIKIILNFSQRLYTTLLQ